MKRGVKLRMEEYVPAATFLKTSFVRDRAELATRFSEFTDDFENAFAMQLSKVEQLEQVLKLTKEQKRVTQSLYEQADILNSELNFLSFYFKRTDLDSGILTQVKNNLRKRNIEGACYKMEGLIQYVLENEDELASKGMAVGYPNTLREEKEGLAAKNASQNEIMDVRGQLHEDNAKEYKKLYDYISVIVSAGKIMYANVGKIDEYTITHLISRMRVIKEDDAVLV